MGGTGYGSGLNAQSTGVTVPPEELLAKMLKEDLGITVNQQALRMFIRFRWDRVQKAAHAIHDAA